MPRVVDQDRTAAVKLKRRRSLSSLNGLSRAACPSLAPIASRTSVSRGGKGRNERPVGRGNSQLRRNPATDDESRPAAFLNRRITVREKKAKKRIVYLMRLPSHDVYEAV